MNTGKQKRKVVQPAVWVFGVVGVVGLIAGCSGSSAEPDVAKVAGAPISAALIMERTIEETQEFSGRLEAIDRVEIRPRVPGFITAVNFREGSEVKKGDVLFVIDPRPYEAEAARAQAAANSALAKADLARLELDRARKLLADKAIAQREFDERASAHKELDASAHAAHAAYEAAKLNLSYTRVTSPIDGRASKAEITLGNLVDASAVLTSVVSLDRIYASFDGDEDTYLRVGTQNHRGQPVIVKVGLANEEGFPHQGKLEFIDNQLDTHTGSVRMRATFENKDRALAPGLFARVQLGGGNAVKNAILVNDRAIGTDQSHKFVFVVDKDNKAEYRTVKLGPIVDGLRVVREGLKPHEKIVVNGLQRVRPGAPITPQMVQMDAGLAARPEENKKDASTAAL